MCQCYSEDTHFIGLNIYNIVKIYATIGKLYLQYSLELLVSQIHMFILHSVEMNVYYKQ